MTQSVELAPKITLDHQPMSATMLAKLVALRVDRAFNISGRATLRFVDAGFTLLSEGHFALGNAIRVADPNGRELFQGSVTGLSLDQSVSAQPTLVVVADDVAYRLNRGTVNRGLLSVSYADAARKILGECSVPVGTIDASSTVHEFLPQSGTNLEFIDSIARRAACVWWMDEGRFHLRRMGTSTGTVRVELGKTLTELTVRASALRPTAAEVTGWNVNTQQEIVGQAQEPKIPAGAAALVNDFVTKARTLGTATLSTPAPSPGDQSDADTVAAGILDEVVSSAITTRGTADATGEIKPGVTVSVANAGPATGDYLVSEVQHDYSARGFTTRFVAGPPSGQTLVTALAGRRDDASFSLSQLVVGIVTNVVDPDGAGRVKVKYGGRAGNVESGWARVLSMSAGKNYGMVFLPEVNDEVLVGFEQGDTRRPIVLGGLFSKKNELPGASAVDSQKVVTRRITSRAGHLVEFGENTSEQYLLLQLGDQKHTIRLDKDKGCTVEVPEGEPITVKSGRAQLSITAQGDVVIEGNNVTIKAQAQLQMSANGPSSLKAQGPLDLEGATVAVKGQGTASVEASGPLSLRGATVAIN